MVEVGPAEGAAGWTLNRHFKCLQKLARGRVTPDAPAVPKGDPEAALGIDGHPVRIAVTLLMLGEDAAVRRVPLLVQIEQVGDLLA